MKKLNILLFVLFTISIFSQEYKIDHKQIIVSGKEKKYDIKISYPIISIYDENQGETYKTYYGFNSFIRKQMESQRDSFIVWMNDWEINEYNKEFISEYEISDTVYYATNKLISTAFYVYSYFAGAAHPNNWSFSINYDLEKSKEIFLKDLLTGGWESKISQICIREIKLQKKEMGIEVDDASLKDGAGPKAENFKVFNVTKGGLLITFPTYQVGAYVEGPSEVLIAYNEIKDIIRKEGVLNKFVK